METFLWLLLFPIVWPFVVKRVWHTKINWTEMFISIFGVCVLISIIWFTGTFSATADKEIWNGEIVSKTRDHGHYIRSYSCNCTTDSKGNSHCQTCYEDRYTVTWSAVSTVGNIRFDHLDRSSKSVYMSPDPDSYKLCYVGEPASLEYSYTNYVKAVPESLFNDSEVSSEFLSLILPYPRVYDFYHVNRVLNIDTKVPDELIKKLNYKINYSLRSVGPSKEANIIVIFVNTNNPSYKFALEKEWVGGKKNDIIVMFGVTDYPSVSWVDVMTWAKNYNNEMLRVVLRDELKENKTIDISKISSIIMNNVVKHYTRPNMEDFEYLKDSIQPPVWVIVLCVILSICGSLFASWWFYTNEYADVVSEMFGELVRKIKSLFN